MEYWDGKLVSSIDVTNLLFSFKNIPPGLHLQLVSEHFCPVAHQFQARLSPLEASVFDDTRRQHVVEIRDDSSLFRKLAHYMSFLRHSRSSKKSIQTLEANPSSVMPASFLSDKFFSKSDQIRILSTPYMNGVLADAIVRLMSKPSKNGVCTTHDLMPLYERALDLPRVVQMQKELSRRDRSRPGAASPVSSGSGSDSPVSSPSTSPSSTSWDTSDEDKECKGVTTKRRPCRNPAALGSAFCGRHQPPAHVPSTPSPVKHRLRK